MIPECTPAPGVFRARHDRDESGRCRACERPHLAEGTAPVRATICADGPLRPETTDARWSEVPAFAVVTDTVTVSRSVTTVTTTREAPAAAERTVEQDEAEGRWIKLTDPRLDGLRAKLRAESDAFMVAADGAEEADAAYLILCGIHFGCFVAQPLREFTRLPAADRLLRNMRRAGVLVGRARPRLALPLTYFTETDSCEAEIRYGLCCLAAVGDVEFEPPDFWRGTPRGRRPRRAA